MDITKRNKKILELAKNKDIVGLREVVKNDPDKPDMFDEEFMQDDNFALMVCDSIVKMMI